MYSEDFSNTQNMRLYNSAGHAGQGVRSPGQVTVSNGILEIVGTADGTTGGLNLIAPRQMYGKWSVRMKAPKATGKYHPVVLLWGEGSGSDVDAITGEIDIVEVWRRPNRDQNSTTLHYGDGSLMIGGSTNVDMTEYHTYNLIWTPEYMCVWIDDLPPYWQSTDTTKFPQVAMDLCIQLDWFPGETQFPNGEASMQVDWVKVWTLNELQGEENVAVLVPALRELRDQLDATFPDRDKSSDGWIGDAAHAAGTSSHNPDDTQYDNAEWDNDADATSEVRAIDIDVDLRHPYVSGADLAAFLVRKAKDGTLNWLRYIIYNRKMYHKNNGWNPTNYTGANPHDKHIHVNNEFSQAADTRSNVNYQLTQLVEEQMPAPYFDGTDVSLLWSRDIDPGSSSYSASGALWTVLQRSGSIANTQVPALDNKVESLSEAVAALATAVAALANDVAAIKAIVDTSNFLYNTVVSALKAAQDN